MKKDESINLKFSVKMNEKNYLKNRLEDQILWYDKKSAYYKQIYHRFRLVEIFCASIIPFLAALKFNYSNLVTGGLGVIIASAAGLNSLHKSHENWIQYRTTAETLKHEKFLYLTKSQPYNVSNRFHFLVQRVEGLISKENSNWGNFNSQTNDEKVGEVKIKK